MKDIEIIKKRINKTASAKSVHKKLLFLSCIEIVACLNSTFSCTKPLPAS